MTTTEAIRFGWAECADCTYRWVAVLDPGCGGDCLECPDCAEMHGRMVKYVDQPTAAELRRWPQEDRDKYLIGVAEYAAKHNYPEEWF